MILENPFYHRGAIRRASDFFSRPSEIQQILGLLRNGQSVSLIGPRRIGKSSLLLHLCRPQVRADVGLDPQTMLFVLVDCQELGGSPAEEVYDLLLTEIEDASEMMGIPLPNIPEGGNYRILDRVLRKLNQQGISTVILLDEFELLAANEHLTPYFFARLRGLTTKHGVAYLTASQRPLFAITAEEEILSSPFFNIFVSLPLGLYTEEESRELLRWRLRQTTITFSDELIEHLLFLVGPHPFFLHIAGYHAFQAMSEGTDLSRAEDLKQLDTPIEMEINSHLEYLWQTLTEEERYTLTIGDGAVDVVRLLVQACLLTPKENGYTYTSEVLRRFIRRQEVEGLIQGGPFVIDAQQYRVWGAQGEMLSLTNSQFSVLNRLTQEAGQVVHAEDLETAVWGDHLADPDRLKTLIKRLRRAIPNYSHWIVSERGIGYALRSPEE